MGWNNYHSSIPLFVVDWNSVDRNPGRQIDWARVAESRRAGTVYTITTSGAAAAAVALPVTALPVALPAGTILNFTGAGETAILTAPAAAGATSLAVEPLDAAIEASDTATYIISQSNDKVIPGGTVMCVVVASGKMVPRAERPGAEEAIGILISTAIENAKGDALSGHGLIVGGVIYENLLPEVVTAYKTELENNGTAWAWVTYSDSAEA